MSHFLEKITSPAIINRLKELCQEQPEIQVLHYILNHPRILEWLHSIGVTRDKKLGTLVPPFPPPEIRRQAAAQELEVFLWTGLIDLGIIISLYEENKDSDAPVCPTVLDFGCGCGRMTRFLNDYPHLWNAYGCDVNKDHVDWCKKNLNKVKTTQNNYLPPFPYSDQMFNLIYSLSVLTHLNEYSADQWLAEIHRILAPNGIFIATTHGLTALEIIKDSELHHKMFEINQAGVIELVDNFQEKQFIFRKYKANILRYAKAGSEYGNTFIHPDYIYSNWDNEKFKVVKYLPGGLRGWQDIVVFQRR